MNTAFSGQVGVITGAASGLGAAIAIKLSNAGLKLALLDRDKVGLEKTRGLLRTDSRTYVLDIAREEQVAECVTAIIKRYNAVDILINCAGITGKTNIKSHEVSTDDLELVFNVNFKGSFLTSKYVIPFMLAKKYGRILHIASISGKEGNAGMLAYSASKSAVIGMAKVQGKEYAGTGIT